MPHLHRAVRLLATLLVLAGGAGARADDISGLLYNTGEVASGNVDQKYLLKLLATSTELDAKAQYRARGDVGLVNATAYLTTPHPNWLANSSDSQWIGPQQNAGSESATPGWYFYYLDVDLTGYVPGTVAVNGKWTADNNAELWLNGTKQVEEVAFAGYQSFSLFGVPDSPGSFHAGVNELLFKVWNPGGFTAGNPSGLRVEFTTATATPVPEASTLLGFGGLLAGGVGLAWRARKRV